MTETKENSSKEQFAWVEYMMEVPDSGRGTIHLTPENAAKAMYKRLTEKIYVGDISRLARLYNDFKEPKDIEESKNELFGGGEITEENFVKNALSNLNSNYEFCICPANDVYEMHRVNLDGGELIFFWH
jgi:hypothetical protein